MLETKRSIIEHDAHWADWLMAGVQQLVDDGTGGTVVVSDPLGRECRVCVQFREAGSA